MKSLAASNKKTKTVASQAIEWAETIPHSKSLMGCITFKCEGEILTIDPELVAFFECAKEVAKGGLSIHAMCVDVAQLTQLIDRIGDKHAAKGELLLKKKSGDRMLAIVKASYLAFGDQAPLVQLQCVIPMVKKEVSHTVRKDFDVLFEALPDSIFIHNYQVITHVNQAFLDLYGYDSKEEILGKSVPHALVHPDDFQLISEGRKKATDKDSVRIPNLKTIKKDGSLFLSESRLSTIYFDGVPHLLVASRDVTQRLHREEQITEANLLMRESQKLAQLGSWQWDMASNEVTWSQELYLIYGLNKTTFKASFGDYLQCVHPDDRERVKTTVQGALASQKAVRFEERIVRPDGEIRHLSSWGRVKTDRDGKPVKMLGVCLDITDQKRSEAESNEKEYQLQQLTESVQSAIVVMDEQGAIQYWNKHASSIFGYTKKEAKTLHFIDLMPEEYEGSQEVTLSSFMGQKVADWKDKRVELKGVRKNGTTFPVELAITSWKQGNSSFACAIITDYTKRKQSQEELALSMQRFQTLFETSLDGIYKSTPEGKFVQVNPALVEMLGYSCEQELLNIDIKNELYFSKDERNQEGVQQDGVDVYRLKKKDGSEIWAEDHGRYEYDDDGNLLYHHGIIRDITKRKVAENNLLQTLNITMEQNTRLMDFSYIVSHNLRSHSSNISGILNIIELTEDEVEKKRLMEMLKKVTHSLDETMYHLNNVVTIQTNKDLPSTQINLSECINKTKAVLSEQILSKKALVRNGVAKDIFVNYNAAYLDSILLNFMSNALKYAAPERRPIITISCQQNRDGLSMVIKDNGIGIDLNKYGKSLFGMYKTFHNNKDARGIGLFISKNQIEAMGGTVTVESTLGKGSRFTIFFKPSRVEEATPPS